MFDKDEIFEKLRSMNPKDVAAIVKEAWDEANNGWVECNNCAFGQEGECWLMEIRDGCYHGELITNVTDD